MAIPKFLAGLRANNKRIQDVADPTAATDAANKQYVDNTAAGLNWKQRVRGASTGNLAVATALVNGLVHDGVTYATGDRIALIAQTAGAENGIYDIVASGAASRSSDANTSAEVRNMIFGVESGTVNGDKVYQLVTDNPTLGTTSLTYTQFAAGGTAYVAGAGLTESPAGTFNVGAGNGIQVTADAINLDPSVGVRKAAFDCAATTNPQTFTHGLGTDVQVEIWEGNDRIGGTDVTKSATSGGQVTVDFGGAPTAVQYRVVVNG